MNSNVDFPTAQLLKEKGYTASHTNYSNKYFNEQGDYKENECKLQLLKTDYEVPTITEVITWLYKKRGIWIEVYYNNNEKEFHVIFDYEKHKFKTPREAYLSAIKYHLSKID